MKEWREGSRLPDSGTQFHVQGLWHICKSKQFTFLMATVRLSFLWPQSEYLSYGHTAHFLRPQFTVLSYDQDLWPQSTFPMASTVHLHEEQITQKANTTIQQHLKPFHP